MCGKDGSIILSKETDNGKEPWDMSIEWTSPDVTIPSQFISSIDDTPTSVGSTTLEVRNFMWYMQGRLLTALYDIGKSSAFGPIYTQPLTNIKL